MSGHIPDALSCDWCTEDKIVERVHKTFGGPPKLDPCSNPWSRVKAETEYTIEKSNDGLLDPWESETVFVNPPFGKGWWRPKQHLEGCDVQTTIAPNNIHCTCGAAARREYIWPQDRKAWILEAQVEILQARGSGPQLIDRLKAGDLTKKELAQVLNPEVKSLAAAKLKARFAEYQVADLGCWIQRCADEGNFAVLDHTKRFMVYPGIIGLVPAYPGTRAWHKYVWPRARAIFWPKGRLHFRLVYQNPDGTTTEKTGPAPMDCCLPYWGTGKYLEPFKAAFRDIGHVQELV